MRALILLLPLAVAFAGDVSPLEEATRRWSSDDSEEREGASRFVVSHLRRELGPLVKALESPDPEVRRRARTAIESLLPPRPPEPPLPQEMQLAQRMVVINNAGGNGVVQVRVRGGNLQGLLVEHGQEAQDLQAKGLQGAPAHDPVLREHLGLAEGRGFVVTDVEAGGLADKLGIRARDILLSIDDRPVMQAADVLRALAARAPKITLLRRGKVTHVGVVDVEGAPGAGK